MRGRIIKFDTEKGFGFIKDASGISRFFHISDLVDLNEVKIGAIVEFDPTTNDKGERASQVKIVSATAVSPKVIIIGKDRFFISKIKSYGIFTVRFNYNHRHDRDHLSILQRITQPEYEEDYYPYSYLELVLKDRSSFRFISDQYFKNICLDSHNFAINCTYKKIDYKALGTFIDQDIKEIQVKLDEYFAAI